MSKFRNDFYKSNAVGYWNEQYQKVGWETVYPGKTISKTEEIADQEIDLLLWPTKEKTEKMFSGVEIPTITPDIHLHPSFKYDCSELVALDYGCGGLARYTASLSKYFKTVFGVDISSDAIAMAKNRLLEREIKNGFVRMCDGTSLGFPSNYFDFIFSNLVLQHIGNKEVNISLAKEFARTLKPGGMARLEYLHQKEKKPDNFTCIAEGNGFEPQELVKVYESVGCKLTCYTEHHPWLWITVVKNG